MSRIGSWGNETSAFWLAHDEELRRLAAEGLTTTAVAAVLGTSKSAVIGRASRIGVKWARTPKAPQSRKVPPRRPPRVWDFPPAGHCVFPFGEPKAEGFRFCAEAVGVEDRAYCRSHHALTHVKSLPS